MANLKESCSNHSLTLKQVLMALPWSEELIDILLDKVSKIIIKIVQIFIGGIINC